MRKTFSILLLGLAVPSMAEDDMPLPAELEHEKDLIFATTRVGHWQGFAMRRSAKDFGSASFQCAIVSEDTVLTQGRAQESAQLSSSWSFLSRSQNDLQIEFTGITVGRTSYQMTRLPWRLIGPAGPDEIVPMFEISVYAFRKNPEYQWLPISYLSDDMMDSDKFTLFYTYENGEEAPNGDRVRRVGKRAFKLNGFREVSKWCGKQLLIDRLDGETRVRELVN